MKRVINFTVGYRPVSLIYYDDEHEGPGYTAVAKRSKNVSVPFGRFKHFEDANEYRKYVMLLNTTLINRGLK